MFEVELRLEGDGGLGGLGGLGSLRVFPRKGAKVVMSICKDGLAQGEHSIVIGAELDGNVVVLAEVSALAFMAAARRIAQVFPEIAIA